jgi:SAM-dependent methyltransferase
MTSRERWRKAQEYELGFWQNAAHRAAAGATDRIDFYEWRAGELMEWMSTLGKDAVLGDDSRIVEIGSGPIGVVGFLPGAERVAVDPLNARYEQNEFLAELRPEAVTYVEAGGESVPLESGRYDMVIMENCIDHVHDVDAVMAEVHRLLRSGGVLYTTVNGRAGVGYYVHRLLSRLSLDPGHPHTFTARRFQRLLERSGFSVSGFTASSWLEAWKQDLFSDGWRQRAKAALFVSEYLLSTVAEKRPHPDDPCE